MRWKVLFGFLVATIVYIVFGALMFMYVEGSYARRPKDTLTLANMTQYLQERYSGLSEKQYEHIVREVVEKYQTGKLQIEEVPDNYPWNFPNTFFFVITALSTIGYGNIAPLTSLGRGLCVAYCLFGIPLMFYTLAGVGERINSFNRRFKFSLDPGPQMTCVVFFLRFVVTFTVGWICFIQLPALMFTTVEGWAYSDSIYFSFVTLTTIGFGDLSPDPGQKYSTVTRLAIVLWLFLGLAWLSTTIKAMQDMLNYLIYDSKEENEAGTRSRTTESTSNLEQQRLLKDHYSPHLR